MKINKVNIQEKFELFHDHWSPKIVGELNGQHVKLARFIDEFIMHKHENEDELFLVVEGTLVLEMEEKSVTLKEGEFIIIPKGVKHKPKAIGEVKVLLFEPCTTLNTGDIKNSRTKFDLEKL